MDQGDLVFPHESYEVIQVLRQALYGEVVLVREPTGRVVVQKRLEILQIQQQNLAENPFNEVAVYDAVQNNHGHPNILRKINHYYTPDGQFFVITTEFAEGGEYFELVRAGLPWLTARIHFVRICEGLRHLHASGWSNLDLSAENILLQEGRPVLMDFGMALPSHAHGTGYRGKVFYAAPELYVNAPWNPILADMWSLGVLLFIMLSQCPPFDRCNATCRRFQYVRNRQQPAPGPLNGVQKMIFRFNITDRFQGGSLDLVQRLLHVDPLQRISLDGVLAHPFCAGA